ncbi:MAG: hypothetical protein LBL06_04820 [Treponema sp.]|nr:hypothetical protein [Treponema sp.]
MAWGRGDEVSDTGFLRIGAAVSDTGRGVSGDEVSDMGILRIGAAVSDTGCGVSGDEVSDMGIFGLARRCQRHGR